MGAQRVPTRVTPSAKSNNLTSEEENASEEEGSQKFIKRRRNKGRRKACENDVVVDLIDPVCTDEYCRKKLIFTNNKACKATDIYNKIVKEVQERCKDRCIVFLFTVKQARSKFK